MFITTGDAVQVSAAVSGNIADFMPEEVGAVIETAGEVYRTWQPNDPSSTLLTLEAGKIYYVVSTADVEIPAFVDPFEQSTAKSYSQVFKGESTDNNFGMLPKFVLPNDSSNLIRFAAVGRDGLTYYSGKQMTATVYVDSAGAVTVADSADLYTFGDVDAAIDVTTNGIILKLKNSDPGYTGTVKWAITVINTQIIFAFPL